MIITSIIVPLKQWKKPELQQKTIDKKQLKTESFEEVLNKAMRQQTENHN